MLSQKRIGKIKFFNEEKGYGFISSSLGEEDVFFHYTSIMQDEMVEKGREVKCELNYGPKGAYALNVRICNKRTGYMYNPLLTFTHIQPMEMRFVYYYQQPLVAFITQQQYNF